MLLLCPALNIRALSLSLYPCTPRTPLPPHLPLHNHQADAEKYEVDVVAEALDEFLEAVQRLGFVTAFVDGESLPRCCGAAEAPVLAYCLAVGLGEIPHLRRAWLEGRVAASAATASAAAPVTKSPVGTHGALRSRASGGGLGLFEGVSTGGGRDVRFAALAFALRRQRMCAREQRAAFPAGHAAATAAVTNADATAASTTATASRAQGHDGDGEALAADAAGEAAVDVAAEAEAEAAAHGKIRAARLAAMRSARCFIAERRSSPQPQPPPLPPLLHPREPQPVPPAAGRRARPSERPVSTRPVGELLGTEAWGGSSAAAAGLGLPSGSSRRKAAVAAAAARDAAAAQAAAQGSATLLRTLRLAHIGARAAAGATAAAERAAVKMRGGGGGGTEKALARGSPYLARRGGWGLGRAADASAAAAADAAAEAEAAAAGAALAASAGSDAGARARRRTTAAWVVGARAARFHDHFASAAAAAPPRKISAPEAAEGAGSRSARGEKAGVAPEAAPPLGERALEAEMLAILRQHSAASAAASRWDDNGGGDSGESGGGVGCVGGGGNGFKTENGYRGGIGYRDGGDDSGRDDGAPRDAAIIRTMRIEHFRKVKGRACL